tara:strand:+ start:811 stop:1578 length:768 start_codon:yes stop_codon:yes gene_type:complete
MKVVILAGGYGTRLSELTQVIPKPMVVIKNKPILWHIMNFYAYFGHKEFIIALGYKAESIKEYFLNFKLMNNNFSIDFKNDKVQLLSEDSLDWKVNLIDTGLDTLTGGRIKSIQKYTNGESFLLTYGDGLCNVNINSLIEFHKNHGKIATMTAVRPQARFGELTLKDNKITSFKEKPQLNEGWINGGYFVLDQRVFDYIGKKDNMFEREPLMNLSNSNELMAYKHDGFWQCMDTKKDYDRLQNLANNNPPWELNN